MFGKNLVISPITPFKIYNRTTFNKSEPCFKGTYEGFQPNYDAAIPYFTYPVSLSENNSRYFEKCTVEPSVVLNELSFPRGNQALSLLESDGSIYTSKPKIRPKDLDFLQYTKQIGDIDFNYKDLGTYAFSPEAREQSTRFSNGECPFDEKLIDGFRYTNNGANYDEIGQNINHRGGSGKITIVDKSADKVLSEAIKVFKDGLLGSNLSDKDKIAHIFNFVNEVFSFTPYSEDAMCMYMDKSRKSNPKKEILLGDMMDTGEGVCRHKALLSKVLGDEIGLKIRIVGGSKNFGPHAWNEVMLDDKKYLFDPMCFLLINMDNPSKSASEVLSTYSYPKSHSQYT